MDKAQAYQKFWEGFGLKAYDEDSLPTGQDVDKKLPKFPYITYEFKDDNFGYPLALQVSVWYRDSSWKKIIEKSDEINRFIGMGGSMVSYDGGGLWIKRGSPFLTRMKDVSDDAVKRMLINVEVEFISSI